MPRDACAEPLARDVDVRGLRLRCYDWGGEGPPALLHHANGLCARAWDPVVRELQRHFRVISFDARGHGASERPHAAFEWNEFVEDILALIEALGLRSVCGIGHSFGGTAMAVACQRRPKLFASVVAVDPVLVPRESLDADGKSAGGMRLAKLTRKRRNGWPSRAELIESYAAKPPFESWRAKALALYAAYGTVETAAEVRLACDPEDEAQIFEMSASVDGCEALAALECPVLILRGGDTDTLPAALAEEVGRSLRQGRVVSIPGTTHFLAQEAPERVAEEILAFTAGEATPGSLPLKSKGLRHVALFARDFEAMEDFYRLVFDMRVVWRPGEDDVYLSSGQDNLALHRGRGDDEPTSPALDHIGFFVDHAEAVFELEALLEARGIGIEKPARRHRDHSTSLYLRDPDGNLLQVLHLPAVMLPGEPA